MNVSTTQQHLSVVPVPDEGTAPPAWWEGLWFEGAMDPRGTGFATALAVAATVALIVVVAAAVRIATGA
jgi:hypothetical protein